LRETTTGREGIALKIREALLMGLPFLGRTPEAKVAGLIDHEEVLDRLAFLLAAVVVLLVLGIGWAVAWSLRTILPNRGGKGHPQAVWRRTSPLTRQRCELAAMLDGLMRDSTRYEGGESTYWHSMATSPRADPALLEEDVVSDTSA
jgi:hypothetical protein